MRSIFIVKSEQLPDGRVAVYLPEKRVLYFRSALQMHLRAAEAEAAIPEDALIARLLLAQDNFRDLNGKTMDVELFAQEKR